MKKSLVLLFVFICSIAGAQDFGFGFDDEETETPSRSLAITMRGSVDYEFTPFFNNFNKESQLLQEEIYDIASLNYKFDYALTSNYIDVYIVLNANPLSVSELWGLSPALKEKNYTPLFIDEVFFRGYMGPVNVEIGYRKLAWGKADSGGPLDVTNPIDYSDLRNITDLKARKIARPMLHLTWNTNNFSKLEGVYIPNFYGHRFASKGRWVPWQVVNMPNVVGEGILDRAIYNYPLYAPQIQEMYPMLASGFTDFSPEFPNMAGLDYFQAGLRFTSTIKSVDIGFQYYYGNLFRPSFTIANIDEFLDDVMINYDPLDPYTGNPSLLSPQMKYNRYHQIGIDYAQVLFTFNIRAEAALHLTEDIKGDMGSVRNPFIGWSFGFDHDIFWSMTLNVQCNQNVRLFNSKIGDNPVLDAEAGTNITSTRITVQIKKENIANLETKVILIWDIEDTGFYIIPYHSWTFKNMTYEISVGIFAGNKESELGYYWKNRFLKVGLKYSF
jgi:hypothetical protein